MMPLNLNDAESVSVI
jgi:hypothetical protein